MSPPAAYKPTLLPEAKADIRDAVRWYEGRKHGLGRDFLAEVRAAVGRINRGPLQYQQVVGDTRRVLLRRFPFAIFYEIDALTIVVLACMHTARDPDDWQRRALP